MVCKKCNHKLPDDSEFCQYCGSKVKNVDATESDTLDEKTTDLIAELNKPDVSPEDALSAILKFQAKATIDAMEANADGQPDNEGDDEFGLVPEKPIYTLALKSVDGEEEYLDKLYTESGEKIKYTRRGSTSAEGINGMIDIYDTFLPSGQPYKTIYINMYGAKSSIAPPRGFEFSSAWSIKATEATSHTTKKNKKRIGKKTWIVVGVISLLVTAVFLAAFLIIPSLRSLREDNTVPTEITASFTSIEELKFAIKDNPAKYNGKRVSVKGYVNESTMYTKQVWLYDNLLADNERYDGRIRIEVVITDELKLSVLEDGDCILLHGVVTIANNEISLNHCDYSIIPSTAKKTIVVAVDAYFYPMEYELNGEYFGAHIDIAKELARRSDCKVTFVSVEFEDLVGGISNGEYDLAFGIMKTPEREEVVSFTESYYTDISGEKWYAIFHYDGFSEWSIYRTTFSKMIEDGTIAEILSGYDLD